jgi:hypothetical protein
MINSFIHLLDEYADIVDQKKLLFAVFLFSHMTQCTTWMDPRPNHYAAFQSFCATLPLPDGFEQSHDARGNFYFIDHNNKQTCWDDPRPSKYIFFI